MTKEEYHSWLFRNLTEKELRNINPKIYSNPDHLDYWIEFKKGNYKWCKKYLIEHRNLLNEE